MDSADGVGIVLDVGVLLATNIAQVIPTHRQCHVLITNNCSNYILCNPRVHTKSGRNVSPLPPVLKPSEAGDALFSKTPNTARGSVGVFTYDLLDSHTNTSTEKIAIMYNVPFDLNLKSNAYALGVFDISKECNAHLFREMSKKTNTTFVKGKAKGPSLVHKSDTVTIRATMSDCHTPVLKVQVSDN